jgi:hypothetical protein
MRLALRLALAASPALLAAACAGAPTQPGAVASASFDPARAPPALAPLVARASDAVDRLQKALARRLVEELADAPNAVRVCRDEAPAITAEVVAAAGVAVGRTGLQLRSPANAPRPWARELVARDAGRPAAEVRAVAVDLGDRVGYLRPIAVAPQCLRCHGPVAELSPGVRDAIQGAYPADQATGFAAGEVRGFFWAEVRKQDP